MSEITRWNPYRELSSMQTALDRFFDDAWQRWPDWRADGSNLALNLDETNDHYIVTTDLPGVNADNINVTVHDDLLTIVAEIPEHEVEHKDAKSLVHERRYGRFSRSVRLPLAVDSGKVDAEYKDGVLKLTLPKSEESKVKTIPVKTRK